MSTCESSPAVQMCCDECGAHAMLSTHAVCPFSSNVGIAGILRTTRRPTSARRRTRARRRARAPPTRAPPARRRARATAHLMSIMIVRELSMVIVAR